MGLVFTLRMVSDLALYLCAACTVGSIFGLKQLPMLPLFIMAACCGLAFVFKDAKSPVGRLWPLGLMALLGFFIYSPVDLLVLLPAVGFVAVTCARQLFDEDKYAFRSRFMLAVKLLPLVIGLGLLLSRETVERYTLPFAVMYLFSSVFLLQMLRQSEAVLRQRRYRLINTAVLAATGLVGLALSTTAVLSTLRALGSGFYRYVISPLLLGVAYVFVGLAWLLAPLMRLIFSGYTPEEQVEQEVADGSYFGDLVDEATSQLGGEVFRRIALAVVIAGLLVLAFFLLRRMLGQRRAAGQARGALESRTAVAGDGESTPQQSLLRRSPREQIRAVFRRFMRLCRAHGIPLAPDTTSRDVAQGAVNSHWCPEELPQGLRDIYIRARYSDAEPTREEARQAKEHYAAIKAAAKKRGF